MAPKTPAKDGVDPAKSDVMVLLNILTSATDLKLDNKGLAPILGLLPSSAKNVPRSLNNRLKAYGFEYKSGKIYPIGQEPGGAATATATDDAEDGEPSVPATPAAKRKTPKAPKEPKAPKTPASKKRKIDDAAMESDTVFVKGEDIKSENEGIKSEDEGI